MTAKQVRFVTNDEPFDNQNVAELAAFDAAGKPVTITGGSAPTVDTLHGATDTGRAVMKATNAAAARSAIGAGTPYALPAAGTAIGGVKPDGKTITAAADGTITAVAQTSPVEYRELVGYENAAQGYAVRVSDRTWLCCFNSFAMQTDGTTRLPYFYAFLRQAGSSSLTALVANPFDTNGITLLSTDGEQMRFSYGGGGRWAGVRAVSGLDAATLILTEA